MLALLYPFCTLGAGVKLVTIPSQDGKLAIPGYWFAVDTTEPRPAVISRWKKAFCEIAR